MNGSPSSGSIPAPDSAIRNPQSAIRAWLVLVAQSFQRHWRVRELGWVSLGLLGLTAAVVAVADGQRWFDVSTRRVQAPRQRQARPTNGQEAERLSRDARYEAALKGEFHKLKPHEMPNPLNPTEESLATLILSAPHAAISSREFRHNWGFMTFSWWVVHLVFMGFVLPLFTLSYASGAFGTERESRSLVWLMTRPIPRSGIYLAKFVGTLPWCLAFGLGGFAAVCLAGGPLGREALSRYWPAAAMATLAFASLFHLVGAIFRRPVVVGLVYVFFFEAVVAALPGSLKLLSLTFYARSLMYNEAADAGYPVEMLPSMAAAVSTQTAWWVLAAATVCITALGMWLFARSEYRDDL